MTIETVFSLIDKYAPFQLSSDFQAVINGYDNSGIIAGVKGDIKGVLFTLDLTLESVQKAIDNNCNLIVTHHPAIYSPIKVVDGALLNAIQSNIGVISAHLNLDCASEGIDYYLASGLGAKNQEIIYNLGNGTGYGRIFETSETAKSLKQKYMNTFESQNVMLFGDTNKKINKVASFCGSGLDIAEIELAKDVDIYISADIKHHVILHALESGKCVMNVSHYSSEVYGYKRFFNQIKGKLNGLNCVFYENGKML